VVIVHACEPIAIVFINTVVTVHACEPIAIVFINTVYPCYTAL
jgi:hypothetical protein